MAVAAASAPAAARSSSKVAASSKVADSLEVRRRLLDPNLSARECLQWLPGSVSDAIGQRMLNVAGIKKHYKQLSMLVHPDKHADEPEKDRLLWTEAYKRLGAAKTEMLSAMGCLLPSLEEDDDDEEAQELVATGRYGEATQRYRRVAGEHTARLGAMHPQTFRTKLRLATVLRTNTNRTGEAEVLLRSLARSTRRAFGEDSYDYLQSAMNLGLLLQDKGDLAGAEKLLREGSDGITNLRGAADAESLTSRAALASLLLVKGDVAEAEPRLKEVCDMAHATLGAESPLTTIYDEQYRRLNEAAQYVC